ncbi:hypothetical protein FB451DRAFT_1404023 [Mycena latifolia]|nr:hypothetical protein FB451DRAFT_1404023 [Mycena latifolia]
MTTRTTRSTKNVVLEGELPPPRAKPRPKTKPAARPNPMMETDAAESGTGRGRASKKSNKSASAPEPERDGGKPPPACPRPRPVKKDGQANTMLPGDDLASDTFNLAAQRVALHRPRVSPVLEEDDDVQEDDGGFKTATYIMIDDALDYPGYIKEEPMDEDPHFPSSSSAPFHGRSVADTFLSPRHRPLPLGRRAPTVTSAAFTISAGPQPNPTPIHSWSKPDSLFYPTDTRSHANTPHSSPFAQWHPGGQDSPIPLTLRGCSVAIASRRPRPSPYILATIKAQQERIQQKHDAADLEEFEQEVEENGFQDEELTRKPKKGNRGKSKGRKKSPRGAVETVDSDAEEDFTGGTARARGKDKDKGKVKAKDKGKAKDMGKAKDTGKAKDAEKGKAKAKETGKGKGKGKAGDQRREVPDAVASTDEEPDGDDDDEQHEDDDAAQGSFKPGPVPADIRQRAVAAHDTFLATIKSLAEECGKSPNTLHQLAGSVIKTSRGSSPWNVWQSWYAEKHPKPGMPSKEFNRLSRVAFKERCGLDPDEISDAARVWEAMPWLRTWHEELMATATLQWRDKGKFKGKVQQAMEPIVQQARGIHDTLGVHVWGYVIDTKGGQASFMWGGSDAFKTMRTQHRMSLFQGILDFEHVLGMIEINKRGGPDGGGMNLLLAEFLQNANENQRDSARRLFARIMRKQTFTACAAAGSTVATKADTFKMQWGPKFLDLAFENKFKLVNYPTVLADEGWIIGGTFPVKITIGQYKTFMPAMEKAEKAKGLANDEDEDSDEAMVIMAWDEEEMALSLDDQREIALVVGSDGTALKRVKHSTTYATSLASERQPKKKAKKAHSPSRSQSCSQSRSRSQPRSRSRSRSHSRSPSHSHSRHQPVSGWVSPRGDPVYVQRPPAPRAGASRQQPEYEAAQDAQGHGYSQREASPPPSTWDTTYPRRPMAPLPAARGSSSRHTYHPPSGHPRAESSCSRREPDRYQHPPSPPPRAESSRSRRESDRYQRPPSPPPRAESSRSRREPDRYQPPPSPPPCARAVSGRSQHESHTQALPTHQVSRSGAEERPNKRKRAPLDSDVEPPPPSLYKCRFNIRGVTMKIFVATHFVPVSKPTRADRYTVVWDGGDKYTPMETGVTPALATEEDRARYASEVELHGLFDYP